MERTKKSCSIYNPTRILEFFGKWKTLLVSLRVVMKKKPVKGFFSGALVEVIIQKMLSLLLLGTNSTNPSAYTARATYHSSNW